MALFRPEVALDDDRGADVGVGVLEHVGEQIVERLRQRVGEDEHAGQERRAGDDGERGEQQAALASQDALQRELEHGSVPEALHAVEHAVGRRREHLVDDLAIGEEDHPVGVAGGDRIVRDHHDRLAEVAHRAAHELEDLGAGPAVEVAGRLVGEDDRRLAGQRPGDRDALLLAAAELARAVLQPVAQADGVDDLVDPLLVALLPPSSSGSVMFSYAFSVGTRLYAWKMKPTAVRRSSVSSLSLSAAR